MSLELQLLRNFDDIGFFGDMGTGRYLAKNRELALVLFGDIDKFDCLENCSLINF